MPEDAHELESMSSSSSHTPSKSKKMGIMYQPVHADQQIDGRPTVAKVVLTLAAATTGVIVLILLIGFTLGELQIGGQVGIGVVDRPAPPPPPLAYAIAIHGGAGTIARGSITAELEVGNGRKAFNLPHSCTGVLPIASEGTARSGNRCWVALVSTAGRLPPHSERLRQRRLGGAGQRRPGGGGGGGRGGSDGRLAAVQRGKGRR